MIPGRPSLLYGAFGFAAGGAGVSGTSNTTAIVVAVVPAVLTLVGAVFAAVWATRVRTRKGIAPSDPQAVDMMQMLLETHDADQQALSECRANCAAKDAEIAKLKARLKR